MIDSILDGGVQILVDHWKIGEQIQVRLEIVVSPNMIDNGNIVGEIAKRATYHWYRFLSSIGYACLI